MVELNLQYPFIHFNGAKQEPKQAFPDALNEIDEFTKFAKTLQCPKCQSKNGFNITTYERGRKQWEALVWCNCGVQGILNESGFHFKRLSTPNPQTAKTVSRPTK